MIRKTSFEIQQWGTKYVYSTVVGKNLYKTLSFAKVKGRGLKRILAGAFGKSKEPTKHDLPSAETVFQLYKTEFKHVPGWFLDEAQALWDCLLSFQIDSSIGGNILEIGVWKGKSAALLKLHVQPKETCVWVDRIVLAEFKDLIQSIHKSNNVFIECRSEDLVDDDRVNVLKHSFRWIHIDGEHSGSAVVKDLEIADKLLADNGIICVDDFPSCAYPQINFAVIEFLAGHPTLTMFACGHNKGYICRKSAAHKYRVFFKDNLQMEMSNRGASVTIWKSGRKDDWNCFGVTDKVQHFDYRGPDWDPKKIEI